MRGHGGQRRFPRRLHADGHGPAGAAVSVRAMVVANMRQGWPTRVARLMLLALGVAALHGCQGALLRRNERIVADAGRDRARAEEHFQRGVKLAKQGKLNLAELAFQNAIIADDSFGPAHNNLGMLQFERGDLYGAAWSFQQAIELMPDRAEAHNNLGLVLEAAGKLSQAIEMYELAYELAPDCGDYLANLVRACIRRGDRDDLLQERLGQLLLIERRPDWIEWAEERLTMLSARAPVAGPTGTGSGGNLELITTPPRGAEPADSGPESSELPPPRGVEAAPPPVLAPPGAPGPDGAASQLELRPTPAAR